jgi:predicted transcriptional regulator
MYFKLLENRKASEKIAEKIKEAETTIEDFNKAYKDMSERKMDPLNLLVLKYCIMNQETRLKWLKELNTYFLSKSKK